MKIWSRSDTLALAYGKCTSCRGIGLKLGRGEGLSPCNCVLRAIFRVCYNRYRQLLVQERSISRVSLDVSLAAQRRYAWGRRDEEFIADFYLVSKRSLDSHQWDIFRFHFLLGADWRLCCKRLNLERGIFFHQVYKIEERLGRIFRDLEPYALFPLDEYFNGASRREIEITDCPDDPSERDYNDAGDLPGVLFAPGRPRRVTPIRPPLRRPQLPREEEEAA